MGIDNDWLPLYIAVMAAAHLDHVAEFALPFFSLDLGTQFEESLLVCNVWMLQPEVTAKVRWVIYRLSELTLGVFVDLAVGEAAFMSDTFVDHVTESSHLLYFFGLTGRLLGLGNAFLCTVRKMMNIKSVILKIHFTNL